MVRRYRSATKKAQNPIIVALANMMGAIAGKIAPPPPYEPKHPPRGLRGRGHPLPSRADHRPGRRKAKARAHQRRRLSA